MNDKNKKQLYLMQQAYAMLFSVTNKLQVHGNKSFDGLTSRQFMTLLAITHLEGEASLSNVARKLGTSKQSVNQIIQNLEKSGYVNIKSSTQDKRTIQIDITDEGNTVLMAYYTTGETNLRSWFHNFTIDELDTFYELLKKLYSFDGNQSDGYEKEIGN